MRVQLYLNCSFPNLFAYTCFNKKKCKSFIGVLRTKYATYRLTIGPTRSELYNRIKPYRLNGENNVQNKRNLALPVINRKRNYMMHASNPNNWVQYYYFKKICYFCKFSVNSAVFGKFALVRCKLKKIYCFSKFCQKCILILLRNQMSSKFEPNNISFFFYCI